MTAALYGIDGEDVRQSGIRCARAMTYRDERRTGVSEQDWAFITDELRAAYGLLKQALAHRRG